MRYLVLLAVLGCVYSYTDQELKTLFDELLFIEGIDLGNTYETRLDIFIANCIDMNDEQTDGRGPSLNDMYDADEKSDRNGAVIDMELELETEKLRNMELQKREESLNLVKRAPKRFDSRRYGINDVVNQGQCGNCYLHAFIGALEIAYTKFTGKVVKFSEQELTDCYHRGCHGGDYRKVAKTVAVTDHLSGRKDYGDYLSYFIKDNFVCRAGTTPDKLDAIKVVGYVKVTPETVESAVHAYGSVMTCVDWGKKCSDIDEYAGGYVYKGPTVPGGCDHAILIVGYTPEYYIVRNSHGKTWGEQGYIRVARGNTCGIEDDMAALVVESRTESKQTASNGCPSEKPKLCEAIHACVPATVPCLSPSQVVAEKREDDMIVDEKRARSRKKLGGWVIPGRARRNIAEEKESEMVEINERCADVASGCASKSRYCAISSTLKKVCAATCKSCSQALVPKKKTKPTETTGKCYRPTVPNGRVYTSSYMNSGDEVRIRCNPGYTLVGDPVKCLIADVYYSDNKKDGRLLPQCVKVTSEKLVGNGATYSGTVSQTLTGKTCDSWNAEILRGELALDVDKANEFLQGNLNFCRNPGGSQPVPFCIVEPARMEYCFKYPGCDACAGAVDKEEDCTEQAGQCAFTTLNRKNGPVNAWKYCAKTCCQVAGC